MVRIIIRRGTHKSGYLKLMSEAIKLEVSIQKNHQFFKELQELLLKYFDVKVISSREITNKLILKKIKDTQNFKKGRRIGRVFREINKKSDEEYLKKRREIKRAYYKKNRERLLEAQKRYFEKLTRDLNKRCVDCGKLLNYRTKGNLCRGCIIKRAKKEDKSV